MRLSGKRAVITGAASGMGLASARRFVAEGAQVMMVDIDEHCVEQAQRIGAGAHAMIADVTDPLAVRDLVASAAETLGGIDCYFNNAGIAQPVTPLQEVTIEQWDRIIAVNLTAIFLAAREAAPVMESQGGGCLLITSSISGRRPRRGLSAYTASKGAAIAFTNALAVELAPAIRVNGIAPLATRTPMLKEFGFSQDEQELADVVPLKRLIEPEDVAAAAVFLASDEASSITGVTLDVDAGRNL